MANALVRTYVRGLDEDVLRGGIPTGHVVLLRGASGTMKSSLAYYILYENALHGAPGLYVTVEQPAGNLLDHVASLGLKPTAVSEALPVLDVSRGREHLESSASRLANLSEGRVDSSSVALRILKDKITDLQRPSGFRLLVIDSWDALGLILDFSGDRAQTFSFFDWLRDLQTTSLLISEEPAADSNLSNLDEEFLADGIIHLRNVPISETSFQRRIQCLKMRGVNQNTDFRTLLFENGRFEVARAIG